MVETQFVKVIAFGVLSLFIIEQTDGEKIDRNSSVGEIQNSTNSLESLIQEKLNCVHNTECHLNSRRKRYVAFPEGSSFSVFNFHSS